MLISPLTHAKAMIGSPGDKDAPSVGFGVQGYVEELTPSFTSAVILVGRTGIAATQMAWGEAVRRNAGTDRLTLDKDILNSKVTYWTDNGACAQNCCPSTVVFFFLYLDSLVEFLHHDFNAHANVMPCYADYCYCNTYRQTPDRRVPMHITIKNLKAYHKSIGLHIDMYHLDSGFWHSAHSDGRCDGINWTTNVTCAASAPCCLLRVHSEKSLVVAIDALPRSGCS
jgi:hypothetical protein